jgi:hypothetical protein
MPVKVRGRCSGFVTGADCWRSCAPLPPPLAPHGAAVAVPTAIRGKSQNTALIPYLKCNFSYNNQVNIAPQQKCAAQHEIKLALQAG